MCGVKADRRKVAKSPYFLTIKSCTNRVTGVLNNPEVVLLGYLHHGGHVEGIAQRVCNHDGFGARRNRLLEQGYINVVSGNVRVQKHRNQAVLHDGVHGGGESFSSRNHLITGHQAALSQNR